MQHILPLTSSAGCISQCETAACGRSCCEFADGNYIVLYPGEIESAKERGQSTAHLATEPSIHGGHRAVCVAGDKSSCDGGYKPLDCASYPYFPTVGESGQIDAGLKGDKCPLTVAALSNHRTWMIAQWAALIDSHPALRKWIQSTKLVGYVEQV